MEPRYGAGYRIKVFPWKALRDICKDQQSYLLEDRTVTAEGQKVSAPCIRRKVLEIFCRTFGILTSCSAWLFATGAVDIISRPLAEGGTRCLVVLWKPPDFAVGEDVH